MLQSPRSREAPFFRTTCTFVFASTLLLLRTAALAGDAATSERTVTAERYATTEAFLNQKLAIWQKRLKLDGWNITFKLVHPSELKPKTLGNIHWDSDVKRATIKILSPDDYKLAFPDALK